ncbi:MAG: hypothetical protein WC557_02490 [Ignavibacteriaceae bacterium]
MKKIFFLVIVAVISLPAQWEVRGSMGLNYVNMADLKDYLNLNYFIGDMALYQFFPAFEASTEIGYQPTSNLEFGLELAYELNSFQTSYLSIYRFDYGFMSPSLLAYYVLQGAGYKFKFGGGIGPRFISADEKLPNLTQTETYSATGIGMVLKAEGLTALGKNVFASIGFDLRYSSFGKFASASGKTFINNLTGSELKMNSLSAGLKIGVAVTF